MILLCYPELQNNEKLFNNNGLRIDIIFSKEVIDPIKGPRGKRMFLIRKQKKKLTELV